MSFKIKEKRKFRKKPIVIEARQVQEDTIVETLEGNLKAKAGDYIVTGVNGEQYPVDKDIFLKTYEPVENN